MIANAKGFGWGAWLAYGLLLWPLALVHVLLKRRTSPREPIPVVITDSLRARPASAPPTALKTCPQCAEQVQAAARICRYCRHEFAPAPHP